MMGNWSLGDYYKEDAIRWSYELLTSKDEGFGLDVNYLYVTVFGGSDTIPRDTESVEIWKSLGIPEHRIYFKSSKSNWWSAGLNSPAGPSTEMFYDLIGNLGDINQEQFEKAEDEQKVVEIWNDVFMVYKQENGKVEGELPNKNVDTGAGLERVTTVVQGKSSIYETDVFASVMDLIKKNSINYKNIKVKILDSRIQNLVFVFGNEVGGLSKEDLKLCDLVAEVPMRGAMVRQAHHPCNMKQGKESLNVAVCVGIVLYSLLNTK